MAITNFIPQIWAGGLLASYHASQLIIPTFTREYEGEAKSGNEVKITSITTPNIQNYGGNNRVLTIDALSDTTQSILINQEKAISFKVDDVDRVQAAGSFEPVTRDAGSALAEDSEQYVIDMLAAGGQTVSGSVSTAENAFDGVTALRKALVKAKAPSTGRYLAVNPEYAELLLKSDAKLTSVDSAGSDGELRNGVIGRLLGFTVIEHPLLVNGGNPAAIAYHGPSNAFVNQIDKVEAGRMELAFADYIRALNVYGAKILRTNMVQKLGISGS